MTSRCKACWASPQQVHTDQSTDEVIALFRHYNLYAMPVVDTENRLVGVVTLEDVLDLADRQATQDVELMAAMQPSEATYMDTTIPVMRATGCPGCCCCSFRA